MKDIVGGVSNIWMPEQEPQMAVRMLGSPVDYMMMMLAMSLGHVGDEGCSNRWPRLVLNHGQWRRQDLALVACARHDDSRYIMMAQGDLPNESFVPWHR